MTTPEQMALLLSHGDSAKLFGSLKRIVLDELHALVTSKRGELLSLAIARLARIAPHVQITRPQRHRRPAGPAARLDRRPCRAAAGTAASTCRAARSPNSPSFRPRCAFPGRATRPLTPSPTSTRSSSRHGTTLLFVNTRSQAEMLFQGLWEINEDNLPIALHHGSLDVEQRRKVESAMVANRLRAVVCTSTLDLGIDWGDVDLVIQVGAPKGASRMLQRIGRANHRLDEPSRGAVRARPTASRCSNARRRWKPLRPASRIARTRCRAGSTFWPSTFSACACAAPFDADDLYAEITPRLALSRSAAAALRPSDRFRRHRRLRATRL